MKKILLFITLFLLCTMNVYAKDSVYSINKYRDEEFNYIIKSTDSESFIAAGTFVKDEKEDEKKYDNSQVMVVKYEQNGNLVWNYHYGKTGEDQVYGLFYSYDSSKQKNGYIIVVKESVEKDEESKSSLVLVVLDEDGELVSEIPFSHDGVVTNILEVYDDNGEVSGYFISGHHNNQAFLLQCDLEFHEQWMKEYNEYSLFGDIIYYNNRYIVLAKSGDTYKLLEIDNTGNVLSTIRDTFEEIDSPHLVNTPNNFILYGFTKEVKLNKKDSSSFYLIQYNDELKEDWETFGNIEVDTDSHIELQPICDLENCREYQLLYTNGNDSSIEIIRIGLDGVIHNKIKKIKNYYYHINSFISENNILYFIGQINCPDDDNCDYDTNSLFLVSNEDKVIEVNNKDSRNILFLLAFFFVIAVMLVLKRKKKKN